MKSFFKFIVVFVLLAHGIYSRDDQDQQESEESLKNQKRLISLNNYPISIFIPQTQQFTPGGVAQAVTGAVGVTGATGATGISNGCLLAYGLLRSTTGSSLSMGETATFDVGFSVDMTYNPAGSPSTAIPTQSVTINDAGFYFIEVTYAGDQQTISPALNSFYAVFNVVINGSVYTTFALSTFGIRETWSQIIFFNPLDTFSIQAASFVPYLSNNLAVPAGMTNNVDNLIVNIMRLGPCVEPA